MLSRSFLLIAVAAVSPRSALSQADSLPRVVITATRVDAATASATSTTTVLDRALIEQSGVRDVTELLRLVPGVVIARSGGPGAQSSLFLRGGENDYVRVLVDGVAVNDAGGALDLAWLSLDDIDRVEVVRGPTSVLYGSDAVTGVVQLFTRRGSRGTVDGEVAAGRYGQQRASVNASTGMGRVSLDLGASADRSDGILPFNSNYDRSVARLGAHANVTAATRLDLNLRGVNDEFHFPTDGAGNVEDRNAFRQNRRLTAAATLAHEFSPRARGELQFTALNSRGVDDDRPDSPADTIGFYHYTARNVVRRRAVDARLHVVPWSGSVITVGGEVLREAQRGNDSSNFSVERARFAADRHNRAVYGQWLADRGRVSVSVGARYDDNSTFGSFGTTRIGVAVGLWPNATVRASAGTAFKSPTFFESFSTAFSTGNADLDPERSRSWELGIRQHLLARRVELGATWFDQKFRDMIQYAFLSPEQPNYFNVAAAAARGLELEAAVRTASRVRLDGSVTLQRTRVDDPGLQSGESATFVKGNRLLRRPSVVAAGRLSMDVTASATTDVLVTHTGRRDDRDFSTFPATPVVLPSWTRVDLVFTKSFVAAARFDLFGRVENVFDRRYEEIANYPAPRRSLTIGVRAASLRR